MEIIKENVAFLSNYEVLNLVRDIHNSASSQRKSGKQPNQLATITYETMRHLEGTPAQYQSAEIIKNFKAAVEPFKLMKIETLQLLNYRPITAVEIQLMVEENEERLTDEQLNDLISIVETVLPGGPETTLANNDTNQCDGTMNSSS